MIKPKKAGQPKKNLNGYRQIQTTKETKNKLQKLKPNNQTWDQFLNYLIQFLATPKE